jgi:hypothetical protein
MVQRLFTDVIHDAIWFMNIHDQNHPWFLAMDWKPGSIISGNSLEMDYRGWAYNRSRRQGKQGKHRN